MLRPVAYYRGTETVINTNLTDIEVQALGDNHLAGWTSSKTKLNEPSVVKQLPDDEAAVAAAEIAKLFRSLRLEHELANEFVEESSLSARSEDAIEQLGDADIDKIIGRASTAVATAIKDAFKKAQKAKAAVSSSGADCGDKFKGVFKGGSLAEFHDEVTKVVGEPYQNLQAGVLQEHTDMKELAEGKVVNVTTSCEGDSASDQRTLHTGEHADVALIHGEAHSVPQNFNLRVEVPEKKLGNSEPPRALPLPGRARQDRQRQDDGKHSKVGALSDGGILAKAVRWKVGSVVHFADAKTEAFELRLAG